MKNIKENKEKKKTKEEKFEEEYNVNIRESSVLYPKEIKQTENLSEINLKDIEILLRTIIAQNTENNQSICRFNRFLVENSEVMRQFSDSIMMHIEAVNRIGNGTKEFVYSIKEMNGFLKEINKLKSVTK